ncbi:serine/threonine-protein kinase pdik1l-B-like [Branchiostoma floridae x Branchiostoma belcheri]
MKGISADFGIARVCERSGWDINSYYMQTAVGTRLYLSPEIIGPLLAQRPDQVTYTAKTDVFALGLILAAILDRTTVPSSHPWFNPGKVTPFLPDPANGQPAPVADVMVAHPGYPAADMLVTSEPPGSPIKALVVSMLAADPHQRPTTEEVLGSLRQIINVNSSDGANTQTQPSVATSSRHTVVEMPAEDTETLTCKDRLTACCDSADATA